MVDVREMTQEALEAGDGEGGRAIVCASRRSTLHATHILAHSPYEHLARPPKHKTPHLKPNTTKQNRDLTDTELNARLGHLAPRPVLLLQSGADECAPDAAAIPALGRRALAAMAGESGGGSGGGGGAVGSGGGGQQAALKRHVVIDGAPHNAAGHEDAVARHVGEFLEAIAASSRR